MVQSRCSLLAARLRAADSFLVIATALVAELETWGFAGIAMLAHDEHGVPRVWAGNEYVSRSRARAYLDRDHRDDVALVTVRASHRPVLAAHGDEWLWVVPLVNCGEVFGTIRLIASNHTVCIDELAIVGVMVSVRLAQLGIETSPGVADTNLTPRQHEVVFLVARGCTNAEIGELLAISADAVKKHVSRALDVLGLSNRTELAAFTARWSSESTKVSARPAVVVDLGGQPSKKDDTRWLSR